MVNMFRRAVTIISFFVLCSGSKMWGTYSVLPVLEAEMAASCTAVCVVVYCYSRETLQLAVPPLLCTDFAVTSPRCKMTPFCEFSGFSHSAVEVIALLGC